MSRPGAIAAGLVLSLAALVGTAVVFERASRRRIAALEVLFQAARVEEDFANVGDLDHRERASLLARAWPPHRRRLRDLEARIYVIGR